MWESQKYIIKRVTSVVHLDFLKREIGFSQEIKMAKTLKFGKRNVELLGGGKVRATVGGRKRTFRTVKEFRKAVRIFESKQEKSIRRGKRALQRFR